MAYTIKVHGYEVRCDTAMEALELTRVTMHVPPGAANAPTQQADPFPVGTEVEWDDAMSLGVNNKPLNHDHCQVQGKIYATPSNMPYGHPEDIYLVYRDGQNVTVRVARRNLKAKAEPKPPMRHLACGLPFSECQCPIGGSTIVRTEVKRIDQQADDARKANAFDPTGNGARQARVGRRVWWDEGKLFGTPMRIVSGKLLGYESNGRTRVERDDEYGGGVYYVVPESDVHDL